MDFLLEKYEEYHEEDSMKPADLEDVFSEEWTREQLEKVVAKGLGHISKVRLLLLLAICY